MVLNETFIGADYFEDLSICDELIDVFEKDTENKILGKIGKNLLDIESKKSVDLSFLFLDDILKEKYVRQLDGVLTLYKENYKHCDISCQYWSILENPNIQKYGPGDGFYSWHTERDTATIPTAYRHLVFMTYLNDVTDGGETEFFYQKIKVQPRKGLTLIWPADWTHTHRGITSPTQTKYIVTGWFSFMPKDA